MMPVNFDSSKKYPLVLFMHGAGERGNDNKRQLVHGSSLFASEMVRDWYSSIVIFPQCPKNSYWSNAVVNRDKRPIGLDFPLDKAPTKPLQLVIELLEEYLQKPFVNTYQIYVGGLSMGGMGTFEIVYRKPTIFAAAFAICGAGNPLATEKYANKVPFWIFHGAKDDVVSPEESIKMVSGIIKNGGNPNFTLFANANHNSWDPAFAEPKLLPWLFSNIKKTN